MSTLQFLLNLVDHLFLPLNGSSYIFKCFAIEFPTTQNGTAIWKCLKTIETNEAGETAVRDSSCCSLFTMQFRT